MTDLKKIEADPIQTAQEFARRQIASSALTGKHDRRIGAEIIKKVEKFIITGIQTPVNHGGRGFSFSCKVHIPEIFTGKDFGSALPFVNMHHDAEKRTREAPSHLIAGYIPDLLAANKLGCTALTETEAGSDVAAIKTSATKVSNGWRLHGKAH